MRPTPHFSDEFKGRTHNSLDQRDMTKGKVQPPDQVLGSISDESNESRLKDLKTERKEELQHAALFPARRSFQETSTDPDQGSGSFRDESNESRLKDLKTERKEELQNAALYTARCTSHKTDLYQLLGFYTVFEGVVFNTVVTSAKLTCQTSLLPAILCILALVAVLFSVTNKLDDYKTDKQKLIKSDHLAKFVQNKIEKLRDSGSLDFYDLYTAIKEKLDKRIDEDECTRRKFKWFLVLFLVLFTATVLTCCIIVRCWDLERKKLMLCAFNRCCEWNVTVHIHSF